MKVLLLVALVGASWAMNAKESMLENNKIVSAEAFPGTCTECKSLVKRFVEASHDEMKMRELKMLLNVLCHETVYVEECRVFVNNIDSIIKKLEPYLADAEKVCKSFHMCSNGRLEAFRRIGLLYAKRTLDKASGMKDLACNECQLAARELRNIVEDKEQQKKIREFFSVEVCIHAGSYRGMCDLLVEQFLPELFQELDVILKDEKKACARIGFCPRDPKTTKLSFVPSEKSTLLSFWRGAKTLSTSQGQVMKSCFDCKLEVDGVLDTLEEEKDGIAKDLQNTICLGLLPANFTPSCEDFMSLYLPTVLYMTFKQYSGKGVCTKMHACDPQSLTNLALIDQQETLKLRDEACVGLEQYLKDALMEKEVQHNAVAHVHKQFCAPVPSFWREACHAYTAGIIPRLMTKTAQMASQGAFCKAH